MPILLIGASPVSPVGLAGFVRYIKIERSNRPRFAGQPPSALSPNQVTGPIRSPDHLCTDH